MSSIRGSTPSLSIKATAPDRQDFKTTHAQSKHLKYDPKRGLKTALKLQQLGQTINQPIRHNCGFPFGDYSDKEVIVKVSDASIKDCEKMMHYTRLISVSEDGFKDCISSTWKYAVLVANNVDIIVKL